MRASVGERLVVEGIHVGQPRRTARIVEVRSPDGGPPFLVHWDDTGEETLVFPGPNAHVEPAGDAPAAGR